MCSKKNWIGKFGKILLWISWELSGLRAIYERIIPPDQKLDKRNPSTFFLWLVGIYATIFGIASQRYENRIDIIENRSNIVISQLSADPKSAISNIPRIQNMKVSQKPEILNPISIINSFRKSKDTVHLDTVSLMKQIIVDLKGNLAGTNLQNVILDNEDLREADFSNANLSNAKLSGTILSNANLSGAKISEANLSKANLTEATFEGANLRKANLSNSILFDVNLDNVSLTRANLSNATLFRVSMIHANLSAANMKNASLQRTNLDNANLGGAILSGLEIITTRRNTVTSMNGTNLSLADLRGVKGLTIKQLSEAKTLYKAQLDSEHLSEIEAHYPKLRDSPKQFFYGMPTGAPATNDLIIRQLYVLSSNDDTKFADWVAYHPKQVLLTGEVDRRFKADPDIDPAETLEPNDYKGAGETLGLDRGHLVPLGTFQGSPHYTEINYLSNIAPQNQGLNRSVWLELEKKVRTMVSAGSIVWVMAGTLYERDMPNLPNADEPHIVPSGFWKIIITQPGEIESIKVLSFIFDQDTPKSDKVINHLCTINEIEERSGLNLLHELNDDTEEEIEGKRFEEWAKQKLN